MKNTALKIDTATEAIVFPPTKTVRFRDAELRRLHEEGLVFRREIERRSASMFAIRPSDASTKMR